MFHLPNSRWQAFGIHLLVSLLLFIALASIIYFLWYPGFLFETDGGWQGIQLVAGVDLVIGPLLTLIVYNKAKKSLKFDLSVIATLQIICIVGGMATVWYSKPLAVIYAAGTFYTANRISYDSAEIPLNDIPQLSAPQPVWLSINLPADPIQRATVLVTNSFFSSISMAHDRYQAYNKALPLLPNEGLSYKDAVKEWHIQYTDTPHAHIRFYTLTTRFGSWYVAVNSHTGQVLSTVSS